MHRQPTAGEYHDIPLEFFAPAGSPGQRGGAKGRGLIRLAAICLLGAVGLLGPPREGAAAGPPGQQGGGTTGYRTDTGQLIFVGAAPGRPLPSPGGKASGVAATGAIRSHVTAYSRAIGLTDPGRELRASRLSTRTGGRTVARYRQVYRDVPVFGSDVIVNTDATGGLMALSAKISTGLSLSTMPTVTPAMATEAARLSVARDYSQDAATLTATAPELMIYDGRMLGFDAHPAALVWKLEVRGSGSGAHLNAMVLVDAHTAGISLQFNQIDTSWGSHAGAAPPESSAPSALDAGSPRISVFTMNHQNEDALNLPGLFLCDESDPAPCEGDADARGAYRYAGDTYAFYADRHGRDSLDGAGMGIVSSVHYDVDLRNAYWDDVLEQMVYGDGYSTADDIVAHELTHGVTQHESNLLYYGQPGAISESFSDLWGEFVDQSNGAGNDQDAVRWLIGEDLPDGGAIRNMKHPPAMSDPDKVTSTYYYTGYGDNAGVHVNSGVNNKAVYLMVEGGAFNGKTVTPLGLDKTARIYYEAQTNLLGSGANYLDLYYALYQACANLVGTAGISAADCEEVRDATDAVQMSQTKSAAIYPTVDYCPAGQTMAEQLFTDDFESGSDNWTFGAEAGSQLWLLDTTNFDASSGVGSLRWCPQCQEHPPVGSDSHAAMSFDVFIPANRKTYLRFEHDFSFDYDLGDFWDGGIVEYLTSDDGTWKRDLDTRFSGGANYRGTISNKLNNPLGGRKAFVRDTVNYTASRYHLSGFAGKNFRVRFRAGSDSYYESWGWFVDDVKIYTCVGVPGLPALLRPAANALVFGSAPLRLVWGAAVPDTEYYDLQVAKDSAFSSLVVDLGRLTATEYTFSTPLDPNTTYYWRVKATNVIEQTKGWSAVRTFRTALLPPAALSAPLGAVPNRRPTFAWEPVAGAAGYTVEVSRNATFTSLAGTYSATNTPFTPGADLPANVDLWWRVRSTGANGPSLWSAPLAFHTGNPPGIPTLISPAHNALTRISTPLLDWSTVTVPAGAPAFSRYQVQVDVKADFSSAIKAVDAELPGLAADSKVTLDPLPPNTKYYWRVRSLNVGDDTTALTADDEHSSWSAVRSFRTALLPPVLSAPVETVPSRRPVFAWAAVAGATGYTVQVSRNEKFTSLVGTYNAATPQFTPGADLPAAAVLWWRARSMGANGPSLWSAPFAFQTGNPPGIPTLISPAHNALTRTSTPLLDWSTVTVSAGAPAFSRYQVQVDVEPDFSSDDKVVDAELPGLAADSNITVGPLSPNAKYYWRVRSLNVGDDTTPLTADDEHSSWSAVRSFRTAIAPPTLISPEIGGTDLGRRPLFTWSTPDGASGFAIQIARDAKFTAVVKSASAVAPSFTPATDLPASTLLYWRVQAKGSNGPSAWSAVGSFTTVP